MCISGADSSLTRTVGGIDDDHDGSNHASDELTLKQDATKHFLHFSRLLPFSNQHVSQVSNFEQSSLLIFCCA